MTAKELAAERMSEAIEIGVDRAISGMVIYDADGAKMIRNRRDEIVRAIAGQLARDFKVIERARGERVAT